MKKLNFIKNEIHSINLNAWRETKWYLRDVLLCKDCLIYFDRIAGNLRKRNQRQLHFFPSCFEICRKWAIRGKKTHYIYRCKLFIVSYSTDQFFSFTFLLSSKILSFISFIYSWIFIKIMAQMLNRNFQNVTVIEYKNKIICI